MTYAQLPTGIILPEALARSVLSDRLFYGSPGSYKTARTDSKVRLGWSTPETSPDGATIPDLSTIRDQSRDLARNEPLALGALNSVVSAVVGEGIRPQSRVDAEVVGLSEAEVAAFQSRAEVIFNQVVSKKTFDAEGGADFYKSQEIVLRGKLEAGDVFVVRRFIERPGKVCGTCIHIVEGERVLEPPSKRGDRRHRGGVQTDTNGFPVGYWIAQQHPGEHMGLMDSDFTSIPAYDKNGDPLVLPIMLTRRPGQTRGMPWLAAVIEPLKKLGQYTEAELTGAVIASMFAVFVTTPSATTPLSAPATVPGMMNPASAAKNPSVAKMQSGMIVDLAPGEDVEVAQSSRGNGNFGPFIDAIIKQIGAALEIPYEVLLSSYQSSYSASRAAILQAWRFYLRERAALVRDYCQPVWEWVITEAVARGLLDAPGFFDDPIIRAAWLATDWIGAQAPQIDPVKEANAAEKWNKLGIISKQDISAAQGRDYDRTQRRIRKEQAEELTMPLAVADRELAAQSAKPPAIAPSRAGK